MQKPKQALNFLIAILLIVWASSFVAIRYTLEAYNPENLAFLRYLIASVTFIVVALIKKTKLPNLKDIPGFFVLGFLGFALYNLFLNYGERTVDAGIASFIINTSPFFSIIFVVLRKEEIMKKSEWFGILFSFTGVAILIFSKSKKIEVNIDALLILAAAISQGVFFVLQKKYYTTYTPLEITSYAVWSGTIILFFFSSNSIPAFANADWKHIMALIYLGIFPGSIAYLIVSYSLSKYKMSNFASYLFLIPFIAVIIGYLFLGEVPSLIGLAGGIMIIIGILVKNYKIIK